MRDAKRIKVDRDSGDKNLLKFFAHVREEGNLRDTTEKKRERTGRKEETFQFSSDEFSRNSRKIKDYRGTMIISTKATTRRYLRVTALYVRTNEERNWQGKKKQ